MMVSSHPDPERNPIQHRRRPTMGEGARGANHVNQIAGSLCFPIDKAYFGDLPILPCAAMPI
jgi:hypothetical protein